MPLSPCHPCHSSAPDAAKKNYVASCMSGTHLAGTRCYRLARDAEGMVDEVVCPNCGHHLAGLRAERQMAGRREVLLRWTICERCRHVGLHSWSFVDAPFTETEESGRQSRRPPPTHGE